MWWAGAGLVQNARADFFIFFVPICPCLLTNPKIIYIFPVFSEDLPNIPTWVTLLDRVTVQIKNVLQ